MTKIFTPFITQNLDNDRWIMVTAVFDFESDVLLKHGYNPKVRILIGFTQDGESVPVIRGRNKRGGLVHDYFSCYDSDPVVPKWIAALVYLEINAYCDSIDCGRNRLVMAKDFLRRWSKFSVVAVWPGYFHKRSIYATCKELAGIDGDPYITKKEPPA